MKKILSINLVGLSFIVVTSAFTAKQTYEAEVAKLINGAFKVNAGQAFLFVEWTIMFTHS